MGVTKRFLKAICVTAAGAGIVGSGAAFSAFVYPFNVSNSQSVIPAVDTIRENFYFDDGEDLNLFDTQTYTVNFYAQNLYDYGTQNSLEYQNALDGYSKWLGHFNKADVGAIRHLGGQAYSYTNEEITDNAYTTPINKIVWTNVSSITQDMLAAMGAPVCSEFSRELDGNGNYSMGSSWKRGLMDKNNDSNPWPMSFLSWSLDLVNTYDGLLCQTGRDDLNGENVILRANSYFPEPNNAYEIPNFNVPLSECVEEGTPSGSLINVYPVYTNGKNYVGTAGKLVDNLEMIVKDDNGDVPDGTDGAMLFNSYYFAFDSEITSKIADGTIGTAADGYKAYRLSGITIAEGASNWTATIVNDMAPYGHSTEYYGSSKPVVPAKGGKTSIAILGQSQIEGVNGVKGDSYQGITNDNEAFDLTDILQPGRYNVYLFAKEKYLTDGASSGKASVIASQQKPASNADAWEEVTANGETRSCAEFSDSEISSINEILETNLHINDYYSSRLGYSITNNLTQVDWGLFSGYADDDPNGDPEKGGEWPFKHYYISSRRYRGYYVYIERSYDNKMVGGSQSTWEYKNASGTDPLFVQNPLDYSEFETQNVDLIYEDTTSLTLRGGEDGKTELGQLTLPGTYFSIRPSDDGVYPLNFDEIEVDQNYEPINSEGIPSVEVKDMSLENNEAGISSMRTEYYSSVTVKEGTVVRDRSLSSLYDRYFDENGNLRDTLANLNEDSESNECFAFIPKDGEKTTFSRYLEECDSDTLDLVKSALQRSNIVSVPGTGKYNFYLKFNYGSSENYTDGRKSSPTIDLYFYKIHNIFVKILDAAGTVESGGTSISNIMIDENNFANVNDLDYIARGDNFYTSTNYYYIYQQLDIDDSFSYYVASGNGTYTIKNTSLRDLFDDLYRKGKCLMDSVTGRYITPWTLENEPFAIMKNYLLVTCESPDENVVPYWPGSEGGSSL